MIEELTKNFKLDDCKNKELDKKKEKEKDCSVCINIFVECDKDHPFKKECKDNKKQQCVCINVSTK